MILRLFRARYFLLPCLFFILWRLGPACAAPEDVVSSPKEVKIYAVNDGYHSENSLLKRLREMSRADLQNYSAKAILTLKTEQNQYVVKSHNIKNPDVHGKLPNGWKLIRDGWISWQGEVESGKSLVLPLEAHLESGSSGGAFTSYDALWVDYSTLPGLDSCQLNVKFNSQSGSWAKHSPLAMAGWQTSLNDGRLKLLGFVDVSNEPLIARESGYLLSRFLHQEPDESWRYVESSGNILLQRRMHLDLSKAVWLDLVLDPTYFVNSVNLSVRDRDDNSPGEIIEVVPLQQRVNFDNGKSGIRINIRKLLSQRFPGHFTKGGKHDFYLQEIFVHVSGQASQVLTSKPLKEMALWGDNAPEAQYLNSTTQDLRSNMRRLEVDLAAITNHVKNGEVVSLEGGELILSPSSKSLACGIRVEKILFVRKNQDRIPVYVKRIEDLNRYLGGPFKLFIPKYDEVEQPEILAYLPLNITKLSSQTKGASKITFESLKKTENIYTPLPPHQTLKKAEIINQRLSDHLNGPFGSVPFVKRGMTPSKNLTGAWSFNSDLTEFYFDWPMKLKIGPDTWFNLKIVEGLGKIEGIEITLQGKKGQRVTKQIGPNRPVHLVQNSMDVDSVHLRFTPLDLSYKFNLSELVIFESKAINYKQALNASLPANVRLKPEPILISTHENSLDIQPGHIIGIAGQDPVRFSTVFDTPIRSLRGITLGYRIPAAYIKNNGGCFLQIKVNWEKGSIQRSYCPRSDEESNLFVPVTALQDGVELKKDLGSLQSIDWMASFPPSFPGDPIETFRLDFAIEGLTYQSAKEQLTSSPLFKVDGKPVFALPSIIESSSSNALKIALPLDDSVLLRILDADGVIEQVDNPLFEFSEIEIHPKDEASRILLEKKVISSSVSKSAQWPTIIFWLVVVLLFWIGARKGVWSTGVMWIHFKKVVYFIYEFISNSINHVLDRLWFTLPGTKEWETRIPGITRWLGWVVTTLIFYGIGLLKLSKPGENYFFSIGGIAAMMLLRASILMMKPWLIWVSPNIAALIFRGGGSLYFAGMTVSLVVTALSLFFKLGPLAEQSAMVLYYCLTVGTVLEVLTLFKK